MKQYRPLPRPASYPPHYRWGSLAVRPTTHVSRPSTPHAAAQPHLPVLHPRQPDLHHTQQRIVAGRPAARASRSSTSLSAAQSRRPALRPRQPDLHHTQRHSLASWPTTHASRPFAPLSVGRRQRGRLFSRQMMELEDDIVTKRGKV
jgi:hypothetical protein